ncbi:hypothetical protein [Sporolactobacillus terrae]|uniref:DUF1798 domain-containing protein n=1 Tax=Sporolactobacillus terrae TaxID=269673 RepID=A0A410D7R3_9BACL|nr:hypothetical protein [Sporolactobacillus terrae]QAA22168.1 hypothetical protein C0674_05795 [Sporolactobacillus terrae]QAA25141.1 hypothetical protein C0679_05770 [Sporolactobacillus terrae]UAK16962.1 hypothetical protein K7399_03150 [Sporolactobacillus terrae]BBN98474.1 hypothetical protein St703_11790 [Sporolactobacillus terrae]
MNDHDVSLPASEMSKDETRIAAEYMLLPLIKRAFVHDRKALAASDTKFKHLYLEVLDDMTEQVRADLIKNKQELFDQQMQMIRHDWFCYEVYARGRLFELVYQKSVAMDWIYERVRSYLRP